MATSSRSTSFHESENIEAIDSWDTLEWTKIEHVMKPVARGNLDFLLEAEEVSVEVPGVVLLNKDEAGTLYVTNFRLVFLSDRSRKVVRLGTIPLSTMEKFEKYDKHAGKHPPVPRQVDKSPSLRLLQIIGKDMRIISFGFRPRTKQRHSVYAALLLWTRQENLWDLYAFISGPCKYANKNPKIRLLEEYFRILGVAFNQSLFSEIEDNSFTISNKYWRISDVNSKYTLCATYPFALIVPRSITDEELQDASTFRAKSRLPVISWCHPGNCAVIARSSQPLVGIMMNMRSFFLFSCSNTDEKLVAALCNEVCVGKIQQRNLYIADARPRKNALANGAMGGGSESSSNYLQTEIIFLGIDNIHAMRESLSQLRDYLDTNGVSSSDGKSSFLRYGGGWKWGRGNVSSMLSSVSSLGDSGWLMHVQTVMAAAAWIAARVAKESTSVLIHCSDGWDRTSQLVSLSTLLLDPHYRTLKGIQALIEKDWLAFGHPFADRLGTPNATDALSRHSSSPSMNMSFPSPMRQSSSGASSPSPAAASAAGHVSHNTSPIFVQWVDCVAQLLHMYPTAFEFSSAFLVDLLDCVLSGRFGNFLCNSEMEREQARVWEDCGCLWIYLESLRGLSGSAHCNPFYDPSRDALLLPPAAALSPTLWPQFHLRWTCPAESRTTDAESQTRLLARELALVRRQRDAAEDKAREARDSADALRAELHRERQRVKATADAARRVARENVGIHRAVESFGATFHFSASGDCTLDFERLAQCHDPGSFLTLKANFEAIDRLSIRDTHFK